MPINDVTAYAAEMHTYFTPKSGDKGVHGHPLRYGNYGARPGFDTIRMEAGWHLVGEFPMPLIGRQYPTEDDYWFEWRKANWQPVTRGPAQDTLKNVMRLFSETTSVVLNIDDRLQEYIAGERFQGKDFFSWMVRTAWPQTPLDPNAFVLCFPHGEGITSSTTPVEVELRVIESWQVYDFMPGQLVSYKDAKSTKNHAIYWIIDDTWFYKVEEIREGNKRGNLSITEYYNHGKQRPTPPPAQVLGGWEQSIENEIIYRSFFDAYFPFANECAKAYSTFQVVAARHGFPVAEIEPRPCDYEDPATGSPCDNGYIQTASGRITCGSCNGTGFRPIHPSSFLQRRERPGDIPADTTPAMRYIEMPDSLEGMAKNWERCLEMAKSDLSKRFIQEAQSGTAKEADREGEYNMMMSLSEWFYGTVIENVLNGLANLREPMRGDAKIIVVPPTDFRIRSAGDLLDELKATREAGTTSGIYVETAREFAAKKYARDPLRRRKLELQLLLDPLATLTEDERQAKRFSGGADDRAMWINANLYSIIEEIADRSPENLQRPDSWWRDQITAEVDKRMKKAVPDLGLAATLGPDGLPIAGGVR